MPGCPPDQPTLQRFIDDIATLPVRPHHSALLERANSLMPECRFRFALTRGGWFRPGGVLKPDGERIADDLEAWLESEAADCDDDLAECLERHADDGLLVTRHAGRTHFFVARYGPAPSDTLQLEVEESQEVLDRALFDPAHPPADIQELLEPDRPLLVSPEVLGPGCYRFRRIVDLRQVMARIGKAADDGFIPLLRFMQEWSSNPVRKHFSDHWIVALREHQDRWNNSVITAQPVSLRSRALKPFHWDSTLAGVAMGEQLRAYDRAAYPGAWYFHMVAGGLVPRDIAFAVQRDLDAGFGYLSDLDARLVGGWVAAPYAV